jgi:hypothetical protein
VAALWKLVALPVAVVGLASSMASCKSGDTPGAKTVNGTEGLGIPSRCEEMATGDFTGLVFGTPVVAKPLGGLLERPGPPPLPPGTGDNVKFLLAQTYKLSKTAFGYEKDLIDACTELGLAAGLTEAELKAAPDLGHGAERACNAASGRVSALFRKAKESRVILDLAIEPMHCFVDVEPDKKCLADCGAPVTRGDVRAQCIGGEIGGACQGRCGGSCSLTAGVGSGTCHAMCSGKCDREFRGTCGGKCLGTCDGAPTRGAKRCAGVCDGTCTDKAQGVCIGRCDGECSGAWEPAVNTGKCAGTCVGGCNGEVRDPVCTGEYLPAGIDPVCQAACGAAAALAAHCETPVIRIAVRSGKPTPELERLLAGVQSALPKIVRLQQGPAKKLPRVIENAVTAAVDWSNAYATAGKHPLRCVRANIDALKETATWIELATRGTESIGPAVKTDPPPQGKSEDE